MFWFSIYALRDGITVLTSCIFYKFVNKWKSSMSNWYILPAHKRLRFFKSSLVPEPAISHTHPAPSLISTPEHPTLMPIKPIRLTSPTELMWTIKTSHMLTPINLINHGTTSWPRTFLTIFSDTPPTLSRLPFLPHDLLDQSFTVILLLRWWVGGGLWRWWEDWFEGWQGRMSKQTVVLGTREAFVERNAVVKTCCCWAGVANYFWTVRGWDVELAGWTRSTPDEALFLR